MAGSVTNDSDSGYSFGTLPAMRAFLLRRLGSLVLALFVASLAVFLLVRLVPGDPARLLLKNPTTEKLTEIRARLALDRPLPVQYWMWLKFGSLGQSVVAGRAVGNDLLRAWPATVELALAAMVLATLVGMWLGIFAARHAGRWQDWLASAVGLVGLSVPVFWLGLLAMLLFALQLGWFPAGDRGTWRH